MLNRLFAITLLVGAIIGCAVSPALGSPVGPGSMAPDSGASRFSTTDGSLDAALSGNGIGLLPAAKPGVPLPPVITSLSSYNGAPGTSVTIFGSGFGVQKRDSIVWFNGVRAHFTSWTDTMIEFDVPADVAAGYVGIQNDAGCSNGFYFIPFERPVVSAISVDTASVGSDITITGSLFGAVQGAGAVSFNGTPGVVKSWTDTEIVVTVPPGATPGYVGIVQNELSSNGMLFTPYYQPWVDSISLQFALVGDSVTITGSDFGASPQQIVLAGQTLSASSWSDTSVTFTVPDGARSGYCGILRDGVVSNGSYLFVAPVIDATSAWWASPGTQVTVTGRGFGAAEADTFHLLFGGARIAADTWSNNAVTFTLPADATSGYIGFTDHQMAATSNGIWLLVMDSATITAVSSSDVPAGSTFSVLGSGFGEPGSGDLRLNGVSLAVISWTDTEIVAVAPAVPDYGYLSVHKSGVDSNGMLLNVYSSITETPSAGL